MWYIRADLFSLRFVYFFKMIGALKLGSRAMTIIIFSSLPDHDEHIYR